MEKVKTVIKNSPFKKPTPWAKAHGISPVTMSRFMNGKMVSAKSYLVISRAIGIPVEELIEAQAAIPESRS